LGKISEQAFIEENSLYFFKELDGSA